MPSLSHTYYTDLNILPLKQVCMHWVGSWKRESNAGDDWADPVSSLFKGQHHIDLLQLSLTHPITWNDLLRSTAWMAQHEQGILVHCQDLKGLDLFSGDSSSENWNSVIYSPSHCFPAGCKRWYFQEHHFAFNARPKHFSSYLLSCSTYTLKNKGASWCHRRTFFV